MQLDTTNSILEVNPTADAAPDASGAARPRRIRRHVFWGGLIGIILPLVAWAILSRNQPEILVPSPRNTLDSLLKFLRNGVIFTELGRTLLRSMVGVLLALIVGLVWGTINGLSSWAAAISRPTLSSLMAVPPIIIVALGIIWLGPGANSIRLVIVLVALPLMVITVQESVQNIDNDLIEMAEIFQMSRFTILRHVIAPAITSPVLAATTVTVSQAIRVAVMAELLSASDGVGARIATSRANLATADLFAWTAVLILMVIALETFLLTPLTRYLLRWRAEPTQR